MASEREVFGLRGRRYSRLGAVRWVSCGGAGEREASVLEAGGAAGEGATGGCAGREDGWGGEW
jgi:hypothetical protein